MKPLASLWRPEHSGVFECEFGVRGLERAGSGRGSPWVAQRWLCYPTTRQGIEAELKAIEAHKPKVLQSLMPASPPPADPMNPFAY